jgi:hypothetical protein
LKCECGCGSQGRPYMVAGAVRHLCDSCIRWIERVRKEVEF